MALQIGLIGCGGISHAHRKAMNQQADADFAAFCDVDLPRAEAAAGEDGGRAYADIRRMLDQQKLDGVVLCTTARVRTELIDAAAERGLPVLCEKPPALELDTARATEAVIQRRNAMVSIAFLFRYHRIVDKLRQIIGDRPVAMVCSCYLADVANNPALIGHDLLMKEKLGGMIVDQAIHNLDLIRFLVGDVHEVAACGAFRIHPRSDDRTAEDTATLQFVTDRGILVTHAHCWAHNRWLNHVQFVGADFDLTLDLNAGRLTGVSDRLEVDYGSPVNCFELEQAAWLDAIRTGDRALIRSTHADAARSLALALAANRAMETRRTEPVEPIS